MFLRILLNFSNTSKRMRSDSKGFKGKQGPRFGGYDHSHYTIGKEVGNVNVLPSWPQS